MNLIFDGDNIINTTTGDSLGKPEDARTNNPELTAQIDAAVTAYQP